MRILPSVAAAYKKRRFAGITQDEVAELSGLNKLTIVRLENGRQKNPGYVTVERYLTAVRKPLSVERRNY